MLGMVPGDGSTVVSKTRQAFILVGRQKSQQGVKYRVKSAPRVQWGGNLTQFWGIRRGFPVEETPKLTER